MSIEINIEASCVECNLKDDFEEMNILCEKCFDKRENYNIQEAINEAYKKDYYWLDENFYVGFKTDEEKKYYMRGIKYGYEMALWGMAEYFDQVEFFDKLTTEVK